MKLWHGRLRAQYKDFEDFFAYARMYSLHTRLGFTSIRSCWNANPEIQGSTDPKDFGLYTNGKDAE